MVIKNIKQFFDQLLETTDSKPQSQDRDHALKVSTAALLVEMANADYGDEHLELSLVENLLGQHFRLSPEESANLVELGRAHSKSSVSLHEFTRMLHVHLTHDEKLRVVEMLWRVAYADAELHRYEDHLVRKVADLLYVRHGELVRLKHRVLGTH